MNFLDCHEEPIHIPGHIQSYGYLLGLDLKERTIKFYSENLKTLLGVDENFLNQKIDHYWDVFAPILESPVYFSFKPQKNNESAKSMDIVLVNKENYHITIYHFDGILYLELEKSLEDESRTQNFYKSVEAIQLAKDDKTIWSELVKNIAKITDYDRVMVYQFLESGIGRVIAEEKLHTMETYMDLYYPESDIPKQARELYTKNLKRIFSNIYTQPIPILSSLKEVDLTYSSVRAMSPIHGIYLKNSGVSSSFSTSIVVENKLWGLVACHSSEPKHIDLYNRVQAELCTVIAANAYGSYRAKMRLNYEYDFSLKSASLKKKMSNFESFKESLFSNIKNIIKFSDADGLAIIADEDTKTVGATPDRQTILRIAEWAKLNVEDPIYVNDNFYNEYHQILDLGKNTCGVAITLFEKSSNVILIWFRKEFKNHIKWAGQPQKGEVETQKLFGKEKTFISPRSSFHIFSEEIRGKSRFWNRIDTTTLSKLREILLEILHSQFEKMTNLNRELSKLNEELDSFSHTISHDLATPLTVMKLNAQMMTRNVTDDQAKQRLTAIIGQIDNMSEMMQNVLQLSRLKHSEYEMSIVDPTAAIQKICEDAKFTYNPETHLKLGNLPEIMGEKTLVYQVFQNLITNAYKYSSKKEKPEISISGAVEEACVVYRISDNGIGIPESEKGDVFKIFKRIDNAKSFQGTGVGLTIVKRIMKRIDGGVDFESHEGKGSTFILKFHNPESYLKQDLPS